MLPASNTARQWSGERAGTTGHPRILDAASAGRSPWLRGSVGAVAAAHPLAVAAGQRMLAEGGSAVDAVIAAQAVLCVVMPQACGLGGDGLFLIHDAGGEVTAVNGTGKLPSRQPAHGVTADGGASVTVPGLVAAWQTIADRWGRSGLGPLLSPAVALAEEGFGVDAAVLEAARTQRDRLLRGGAAQWAVIEKTQEGDRLVQLALAATLRAVASEGASAFYTGSMADRMVAAVSRDGGHLHADDLAAHDTVVALPIEVEWRGGQAYVQPPVSQGVLLAMALRWLEARQVGGGGDALDHTLVELIGAVFEHRSRAAEGSRLLDEPLSVDTQCASGRTGPRAYLHTAGVAAADASGQVVSSLASVFDDFGSATFVPEAGFTLNNRAGGFTEAPNDAAPGKRPVHTLAPALVRQSDNVLAVSTPGADGQVQTLLQVLARARALEDLPAAIGAPRWRSQAGELLVERDHPHTAGLVDRGHEVVEIADGDDLFGAVVCAGRLDGWPVAVADWRRQTWSGVA